MKLSGIKYPSEKSKHKHFSICREAGNLPGNWKLEPIRNRTGGTGTGTRTGGTGIGSGPGWPGRPGRAGPGRAGPGHMDIHIL